MKNNNEIRSVGTLEIRSEGEGKFSGYVVKWNTVDSYNTTFKKGAFKKTLSERASKIKLLWNHDMESLPIGVVDIIEEDDIGVRFEATLAIDTDLGGQAHTLMKMKAIDAMSFGFRTIKSGFLPNGTKEIQEVALMEISPVNFPANQEATIDNVRAADFNETVDKNELYSRGYKLRCALMQTLDDIVWNYKNSSDVITFTSKAITDFASAYGKWQVELYEIEPELRGAPDANELSKATQSMIGNKTIEEFAQTSRLTLDEIRSLRRGQVPHEVDARLIACDEVRSIVSKELEAAKPALQVKEIRKVEAKNAFSPEILSAMQALTESLQHKNQ